MRLYLMCCILWIIVTGCHSPMAPRPLTLESAFEQYNWAAHTEPEFWTTYPQFRAQYDALVMSYREGVKP